MRLLVEESTRYSGSSKLVVEAAALADDILAGSELYEMVEAHPGFDLAELSPKGISDAVRSCNVVANVVIGRFRMRRVYASTGGERIIMNSRSLYSKRRGRSRGVASVVGTLVHEYVHVVDNQYDEDFGHGTNSSRGKANTAPYWIGSRAIELANKMLGQGSGTLVDDLLAYAEGIESEYPHIA